MIVNSPTTYSRDLRRLKEEVIRMI